MAIAPFTCYIKVALPPQLTKWEDYWLQVHGFWLIISKKLGAPGYFVIPLDLVQLQSGETETNIQNSLYIETSPESGAHKLYISSTSRIEIIELFKALNTGWSFFRSNFQAGKGQEDTECEYRVASGFMNLSHERRRLALTRDRLIVGDSKVYPIHTILAMTGKQGDPNCTTRLLITVQTPEGPQQKEFSEIAPQDMKRMYWSYLMHIKALAS
jgi:hypothetical protein